MEMNNGQNDVMDCLKRVKNIEGFDPTCRTYVMKRQLEESKGTQVLYYASQCIDTMLLCFCKSFHAHPS